MKVKTTKSGNTKIKLSEYELAVFHAVLSYVRLGSAGMNNRCHSDVIFEFLEAVEGNDFEDLTGEVGFSYSEDQGMTIEL